MDFYIKDVMIAWNSNLIWSAKIGREGGRGKEEPQKEKGEGGQRTEGEKKEGGRVKTQGRPGNTGGMGKKPGVTWQS